MNYVEIASDVESGTEKSFVTENFYRNGKPVEGAFWGMTLRNAGTMRFRWAETNPNRDGMLSKIAEKFGGKTVVPVELNHTKIVYSINSKSDTDQKVGDGLITKNAELMPVVTVADCIPLYFFDSESGFFGVVHSGWKGTGIVAEAVSLAEKTFGADRKNISVAIGAHIHDCCYVVNKERADYFASAFTADCVASIKDGEVLCRGAASNWDSGSGPLYRLSLLKANLAVLEKSGIRDENLVVAKDCTCCGEIFGSNRRETSLGNSFTVQAAFTVRIQ